MGTKIIEQILKLRDELTPKPREAAGRLEAAGNVKTNQKGRVSNADQGKEED